MDRPQWLSASRTHWFISCAGGVEYLGVFVMVTL
ncbi:MAG: hypothetical protein JG765_2177 [Cereibacter sp.]|jgi:hypothetical protein|nr:hypothetical protein [Cereibacter sp.]